MTGPARPGVYTAAFDNGLIYLGIAVAWGALLWPHLAGLLGPALGVRPTRTDVPAGDDLDLGRAALAFDRGRYAEALRRTEAILAARPDDPLAGRLRDECLAGLAD